jgi:hypothetical protein
MKSDRDVLVAIARADGFVRGQKWCSALSLGESVERMKGVSINDMGLLTKLNISSCGLSSKSSCWGLCKTLRVTWRAICLHSSSPRLYWGSYTTPRTVVWREQIDRCVYVDHNPARPLIYFFSVVPTGVTKLKFLSVLDVSGQEDEEGNATLSSNHENNLRSICIHWHLQKCWLAFAISVQAYQWCHNAWHCWS